MRRIRWIRQIERLDSFAEFVQITDRFFETRIWCWRSVSSESLDLLIYANMSIRIPLDCSDWISDSQIRIEYLRIRILRELVFWNCSWLQIGFQILYSWSTNNFFRLFRMAKNVFLFANFDQNYCADIFVIVRYAHEMILAKPSS